MENLPKIIKVQPWTGFDNEIYEGKKTKVILRKNRMEYAVEYVQKVKIAFIKDDQQSEAMEQDNFCKEDGTIDKDAIKGFVRYIETEYTPVTGEPVKVYKIDIANGTGIITIAMEKEEDQVKLYKEIYDWKYDGQD